MKKEYIRYIILIVVILVFVISNQCLNNFIIDNYKEQGSTSFIENLVNITYVENTGGAWGIGQNDLGTFIIANILVIGIIIRFIVTQKDRIGNWTLVSLALILSGGISNCIDRIFRGYIVDYMDITPILEFPIFNLADMTIFMGWILFVVLIATSAIKLKNEKVEDRIEKINNK